MRGALMRAFGCLLLIAAAPAWAEWNADLYGGSTYTPRSAITVVVSRPGGSIDHTFDDVKWNNSAALGARAGHWLAAAPWYGVGVDLFQYSADVPTQTVDATIGAARTQAALQPIDFRVTAIALDLIRLRYRAGALEPYASAGPTLFKIKVTNRGNGEFTSTAGRDDAWGYKLAGGLAWRVSQSTALFGEYRFTHVHSETALDGTITGSRVPVRFDLDSHHFVAGVSLRF
jgi:opacity protein-like surface antigen